MPTPAQLAAYQNQVQQWMMQQQQGQQNQSTALAESYQRAQDSANQANWQRYNDIFQGRVDTRNQVLNDVSNLGTSMRADAAKQYKQVLGGEVSDLSNRGLSSSTIKSAVTNRANEGYTQDKNRIEDQLLSQRISANQNTSNDLYGFMERRNDVPPDLNQLISMQRGLGQAGYLGSGPYPQGPGGQPNYGQGTSGFTGGVPYMPGQLSGQTGQQYTGGMPPYMPGQLSGQNNQYMAMGGRASAQPVTGQIPFPVMPTDPAQYKDTAPWMDNANNPNDPANQMRAMQQQGYNYLGNNNYMRPGSPMGGNGAIPNQYVSGPPPAGTNIQQGQPMMGRASGFGYLGGMGHIPQPAMPQGYGGGQYGSQASQLPRSNGAGYYNHRVGQSYYPVGGVPDVSRPEGPYGMNRAYPYDPALGFGALEQTRKPFQMAPSSPDENWMFGNNPLSQRQSYF